MKRAKGSLAIVVMLMATSILAADSLKSLLKEFEQTTGEFVDVLKANQRQRHSQCGPTESETSGGEAPRYSEAHEPIF